MMAFCIILVCVCIGEFLYIVHIRRQLAKWLIFIKGLHEAPGRHVFVKGNGILADINFELNHILEENRKQLVKLQRAENANRQLLTDLSHDVRTPLSSLTGYLEALDSRNTNEREEYIHVAYHKALDLQELIDMLFQWFKLASDEQRYRMKDYDINELTREVMIEHLAVFEKKQISLLTDIPDDEWPVWMDRMAYARIMGNLVSNAIKHGKCSLIEVAIKKRDNRVSVLVANDGMPIPAQEMPYIFERLYECDNSRCGKGNGLGLAIVRKLVNAMDGEITVESIPGGKTTFCLLFPLSLRHED